MPSREPSSNDALHALLVKAYNLGLEVGYYRHNIGYGWLKKEYSELIGSARELDMEDSVVYNFQVGKRDGAIQRQEGEIQKNMESGDRRNNTSEDAPSPGEFRHTRNMINHPGSLGKSSHSEKVKHILRPEVTDRMSFLEYKRRRSSRKRKRRYR